MIRALLAIGLLLIATFADAAITDTTRKAENAAGSAGSVTVTLNSTVAGNLVVVGCSIYNANATAAPSLGITDGGNTYSQVFKATASSGSERQLATLWYSILGTGGNRSIVIDANDGELYDWWCAAHEFAGADAVSGTAVTNTGTTQTTSDTTAFTPADADTLYVAVDGHSASGTVTENVSPGDTDWTLSNENESGSSAEPGSMVWFILSGAAVARRAAWTIPSGTFWAAGIGAFKPAIVDGRRVTEAGDCRITEASDRRILEGGAGSGGTCEGGGGGATPNNMRLLMGVGG